MTNKQRMVSPEKQLRQIHRREARKAAKAQAQQKKGEANANVVRTA